MSSITGFVMFCDDVRQETDGKHILIGCYQGNMFLQAFPANINKFGFYITIFEPFDSTVNRVSAIPIYIYLPGDAENTPSITAQSNYQEGQVKAIRETMPKVSDPEPVPMLRMTVVVMMSPLMLQKPGIIRVVAKDGDELVELGKIRAFPQVQ